MVGHTHFIDEILISRGVEGDFAQVDHKGRLRAAGYGQTVIVSKVSGNFNTIQGAIDSITDASITNRYCVWVHSGTYSESITCKDYVDIIGDGRTNTIISGTSGTVLTFPATKCTVSEIGISVDYGALGATSAAITSAGADSVMKDCDVTVTKSSGDVVQSGVLTTIILNNNEMTLTSNDTNDYLVGFESTATVTGTALFANNVISIDTGVVGGAAAGMWIYGTATGCIFNQNRLTIQNPLLAWGLYIDSTAGGATVDTRHNEIIVTSAGASVGCQVAVDDTWNSTFDRITATAAYAGAGTVVIASSEVDGGFTASGRGTFGELVIPSGTAPSPAVEGALFLDTDASANGSLYCYSNSAWRKVVDLP
jgi:hypothetical protein